MTARVVIFGPSVPGDSALENSRWVAAQHVERLGEKCLPIVDENALRGVLEAALGDAALEGAVLCGHGDGGKDVFLRANQHHDRDEHWHHRYSDTSEHGAVYGSDGEPVLDHENVHLAAGRWVHVLACEVGISRIPESAVASGVVAFAAYEQRLVPEFTVSILPSTVLSILGRIVTMTTLKMSEGQRDGDLLAGEVRRASEDLQDWFDSEEGAAWSEGPGGAERIGLTKFAMQLSSALRVRVPG